MKHIKTLNTKSLQNTVKKGGCGECQTSCQSACKTSCTVGNQSCEHSKQSAVIRNNEAAVQKPLLVCVVMHAEEVRWTFLERERGFVVVHRYINNDCHIVLDVNSGSVHIVDEIVYDAVGLLEDKLSFEETAKILSEKYALEEVLVLSL